MTTMTQTNPESLMPVCSNPERQPLSPAVNGLITHRCDVDTVYGAL